MSDSWNYSWYYPSYGSQEPWNPDYEYSTASANATVVAQHGNDTGFRGVSDQAPLWNADSNTLDLWIPKVKDWEQATRISVEKRAFHVRSTLPPKVKERIRAECDEERLKAKPGTWREGVKKEDNLKFLQSAYTEDCVKYQKVLPLIAASTKHWEAQMQVSSGIVPDPILVEATVKSNLGSQYVEKPQAPALHNVQEVPEGAHDVHGSYTELDGTKIEYGNGMSSNLDYLMELIRGTQLIKPINRYLYRLRRFLSVRRGKNGSVVDFLNEFQTRKAELYADKLYTSFHFPESLSAALMLTFADVTDSQYVVLMGRLDQEDISSITEEKMESILRNILGLADDQKQRSYLVQAEDDYGDPGRDPGSDAYRNYQNSFWTAHQDDEWYDAGGYWANSNDNWSVPDTVHAQWDQVHNALNANSLPPLLPGEAHEVEVEGVLWTFDDNARTYIGVADKEWDETAGCYKAKAGGKGGKRMRRRFPKRNAKRQKAGFLDAWERLQTYWTTKGGGKSSGQGKGKGGYKKGKSGKGWFGDYLPYAEFQQRMKGKKPSYGGKKGKAMMGTGDEMLFVVNSEQVPFPPKASKSNFETSFTTFEKNGRAKYSKTSRNKRQIKKQLHPYSKAKFLTEEDAGWCIWDIGCSKAVMSEHAKRPLMNLLKKAGISQPQTNQRQSQTRYSFADGDGNTKTPGYKADIASIFNGKVCRSEWEVLDKGKTPPLFSLDQTKNLWFDASFRPWGVTVSSEKLGWVNKEVIEKGGHLQINMVDTGPRGVLATGECEQDVPTALADTPAPTDNEAKGDRKAPSPENNTPTLVDNGEWEGYESDSEKDSDNPGLDLVALEAQAKSCGGNGDGISDKGGNPDTVNPDQPPDSAFFTLINSATTVWGDDPVTVSIVEHCKCASNAEHGEELNSPGDYKDPNYQTDSGSPAAVCDPKKNQRKIGKINSNNKEPAWMVGPYHASEILKLHSQWQHCRAGQLLKRLKARDLPHAGLNFENVQKVLQRCTFPSCQALQKGPNKPLGTGLVPDDRNAIVCQDTFFPDTPQFSAGIQHQIDALTRLSVLTADTGKGPDTQDAVHAAAQWDAYYGPPKLRLTDNGPEYGQFYTDAAARSSTEHRTTPTYSAFSNGICERAHQKAKYILEVVYRKNPKARKDDVLLAVQKAMNQEVKANGRTPFEMSLGRPVRAPDFEENVALWEDAADIVQQEREKLLLDAKKALLEFYSDIQVKKALRAKLQRERGLFTLGSRVWYYRMGKQNTKDAWVGPAKVLAINGRLVIIQYGSICMIIHDTRIRPYYPPIDGNDKVTPGVEPLDFAAVPPQQRGRHLVQNQGELILEQIHEQQVPLDVDNPITLDPIPEVMHPFGEASAGDPSAPHGDTPGDPSAPAGQHTPYPATGAQEFFIGSGPGSTPLHENPTEADRWFESVTSGDRDVGGGPLGGQFSGEGAPINISPRDLSTIQAEFEGEPPSTDVPSFGPTIPHPPTRHSPHKKVTFPYPAPPTLTTRPRAAPKRYGDPGYVPTSTGKLATTHGGEGIDQSGFGLLTFEKVYMTTQKDLEADLKGIDHALQSQADHLWMGHGRLTSDIDKNLIDLCTAMDEAFTTDLQICPEYVYAISERLMQEDTPMRELTMAEIEKHVGLVESARELEYMSFHTMETFKCVKYQDIPPHPDGKNRRVMTTRELIQWKAYLNKVKVRVVLRGFQDDRRKRGLYHTVDSPTVRGDSVRMLYQLAADHGYDIWAWDLKTAFLQGFKYDKEADLIYWEPPPLFRKFFNIPADECCVALKSVYGLDDAPRRWYEKLATKLCEVVLDAAGFKKGGFGLKRHWLDPCLFFKHGFKWEKKPQGGMGVAALDHFGTGEEKFEIDGLKNDPAQLARDTMPTFADISVTGTRKRPILDGDTCLLAAGTHVDDIIAAGDLPELELLDSFLSEVFNIGKLDKASGPDGILYRGVRIRKPSQFHVTVSMREYEEREIAPIKFQNLPVRIYQRNKDKLLDDKGQTHYRGITGKLIWVGCNTRVDTNCMTSQAATMLGKATEADAIFINKIVDHIMDHPVTLQYYRLADISVPRCLRGSSDAAFKRRDERDERARGGYLLCIGTRDNPYVGLISFGSAKIHRVCKSPTGAEAIAISGLGDQMDNAYHLFFWFYPKGDPTGVMLTDAFSVTSTQFKYCGDVSANLTVDVALIRSRVRDGYYELVHQLGEFMAADGLTKNTTVANKVLMNFLLTNLLGAEGVDMVKITQGVKAKLAHAFAAHKIHPNNVQPEFIDKLAQAVNCDIRGVKTDGRYAVFDAW